MVWGRVKGFVLIPGLVYRWTDGKPKRHIRKVVWFGDGIVSKVRVQTVCLFYINSLRCSGLTCSFLFYVCRFIQMNCCLTLYLHSVSALISLLWRRRTKMPSFILCRSDSAYMLRLHGQRFIFMYCSHWYILVIGGRVIVYWQAQELQLSVKLKSTVGEEIILSPL